MRGEDIGRAKRSALEALCMAAHLLKCGSESLLVKEVGTLAHRMDQCAVHICRAHTKKERVRPREGRRVGGRW